MLQLRHEDLAFDPVRQVYYATISSVDRARGNAIATIDLGVCAAEPGSS